MKANVRNGWKADIRLLPRFCLKVPVGVSKLRSFNLAGTDAKVANHKSKQFSRVHP